MEYIMESDVKEFINRLPNLNNSSQVHLLMLAVRSRKAREMLGFKVKDLVVERKIIRAIEDWKDRYFNAVYNMSILQHMGRFNTKGVLAPAESMGIFGTLSPRNVITALEQLTTENMKHLFSISKPDVLVYTHQLEMMELAKQNSKWFGALHAHRDRDYHFVTIDIDDPSIYPLVKDITSPLNVWMITETSRGYHIILDLSKSSDAEAYYGRKPQDGIHYQLDHKFKGLFDFQRDSQEPCLGTAYYRKRGEIHFVTLIQ